MSTGVEQASARQVKRGRACYVYGIVPADVEVTEDAVGIGDPPAEVHVVRRGDIAALVSEVDTAEPLGTPDDLRVHAQLLDDSAVGAPVLPLRFGAVLTDEDAVATELLEAHAEEFSSALEELEGRAQYVVRARYVEKAVLEEILRENPEIHRLRRALEGKPEEATRNERIQLGELINRAIEVKRQGDTDEVVETLNPLADYSVVRDPTHEEDAANVAFLVSDEQKDRFLDAVDDLERRWDGRIDVRLLGPMAAYDFVAGRPAEGAGG